MADWKTHTLGEVTDNHDSKRRPVKATDRVEGVYPYYGASGVIDHVEEFIYDGEYLLVAEDGENLRSRSTPIAFLARGRFWVNNHAHVLTGNDGASTPFLAHLLSITNISGHLTGSTQPKLTRRAMDAIELLLPPKNEQEAIADMLGALDDKIAANARLVQTADDLAQALTSASIDMAASVVLSDIAELTMGSSPPGSSYNEGGLGAVFYQGVRDFGVRFPTNRVWTTEPVRMAERHDTLLSVRAPVGQINLAAETICIGRGLAAIRSTNGTPMTLFHLLKDSPQVWEPYEAGGTVFGSINKKQLAGLAVPVVLERSADALEGKLRATEDRIESALNESETLARMRDTLLPELMSGRLRVKDAERVVEGVV